MIYFSTIELSLHHTALQKLVALRKYFMNNIYLIKVECSVKMRKNTKVIMAMKQNDIREKYRLQLKQVLWSN